MATLNDICYKQIIDKFWYGLYGDFILTIDKSTGCFNATTLCQNCGKNFNDWLQRKRSTELIEYFKEKLSISNPNAQIMYTIAEDKNETYKTIVSGTYIREEFILDITCWISREFFSKITKIVFPHLDKDKKNKKAKQK